MSGKDVLNALQDENFGEAEKRLKSMSISDIQKWRDDTGWSLLHWACSKCKEYYSATTFENMSEVLDILTKHIDINIQVEKGNFKGMTPLHSTSNAKLIRYLCEKGANPNISDSVCTPIHYSMNAKNYDAVLMLAKHGANIYTKAGNKTVPQRLIENGENDVLEKLYEIAYPIGSGDRSYAW